MLNDIDRYVVAQVLLDQHFVEAIRQRLGQLFPQEHITDAEIDTLLRCQVMEKDLVRGEQADAARRLVNRPGPQSSKPRLPETPVVNEQDARREVSQSSSSTHSADCLPPAALRYLEAFFLELALAGATNLEVEAAKSVFTSAEALAFYCGGGPLEKLSEEEIVTDMKGFSTGIRSVLKSRGRNITMSAPSGLRWSDRAGQLYKDNVGTECARCGVPMTETVRDYKDGPALVCKNAWCPHNPGPCPNCGANEAPQRVIGDSPLCTVCHSFWPAKVIKSTL